MDPPPSVLSSELERHAGALLGEWVKDPLAASSRPGFVSGGELPAVREPRDGYTKGSGLGLGLGGAKRLVNEPASEPAPGRGTRVTETRWR